MDEKTRQRIEQKIKDIGYSMKHKHPFPEEWKLRNYKSYGLNQIVEEIRNHSILQGIQYGLEKALEYINEEESEE